MAQKATRSVESFRYTPKGDRALPVAEQSHFTFRPLTQAERMQAIDESEAVHVDGDGSRSIRPRGFQQARELVLATLVKTENFPAGEPVPYPVDGKRAELAAYLEMLDDLLVFELGNHVMERSTLGVEEKNS